MAASTTLSAIPADGRRWLAAPTTSGGDRVPERRELDLERYDHEMGHHVYLQRVQEHIEGGIKSRVRSTPTFFVNGVVYDVSFGLEHLQEAIETELGPTRYARRRR